MRNLLRSMCHASLLAVLMASVADAQMAVTVNFTADPATPANWNVDANWSTGFVPFGRFNEQAFVNNGGVAFVEDVLGGEADPLLATGPGGLFVTAPSTLQIRDTGSLTFNEPVAPPIDIDRSALFNGTLNIQGAGNLNLQNITFAGSSNYAIDLTTTTVGSPVVAAGQAQFLGSTVTIDYSAIANPLGTRTILDAATVAGPTGVTITDGLLGSSFVSNAQFVGLSSNQIGFLSATPGGNGTLVQANVIGALNLTVNRVTGEVSIQNGSTDSLNLDGFSVQSALGTLTGTSNLLGPGWTASAANSNNAVSQLFEGDLVNTTDSIAAGTSTSIGTGLYTPVAPTEFLQQTEDVTFQYTSPEVGIVNAAVEFVGGEEPINNLVLTVDANGNATIQNTSPFSPAIEAYRITSESGSLETDTWVSVQDSFGNTWSESLLSGPNQLFELQEDGTTTLDPGEGFSLGDIFDVGTGDFVFEFLLAGESELTEGVVVFGDLPLDVTDPDVTPQGIPGDFDGDGDVDGADFLAYQRGESPDPLSAADLTDLLNNYGADSSAVAAATAVPEPVSIMLLGVAGLCLASSRRR